MVTGPEPCSSVSIIRTLIFTLRKPRPESGLDCLLFTAFARQCKRVERPRGRRPWHIAGTGYENLESWPRRPWLSTHLVLELRAIANSVSSLDTVCSTIFTTHNMTCTTNDMMHTTNNMVCTTNIVLCSTTDMIFITNNRPDDMICITYNRRQTSRPTAMAPCISLWSLRRSKPEQKKNNLRGFKDFCLKAKARIWS